MKFTLYFLENNLQVVSFAINGKEYSTADIRESWGFKKGLSNEVQLVTSKTYLKSGTHFDCDHGFDNLIKLGAAERRIIETEPTLKEWNDFGLSYTTIQHDALIFANKEYCEKKVELPIPATHITSEGIETQGWVIDILPNEFPIENRTCCIFKPEDGPELELFLDEIKYK